MKSSRIHRGARGFSLMELLVVVTIIIILAGLTIAGMGFAKQAQARKKADTQIHLLEVALEDYNSDNRAYPEASNADGLEGSQNLYKVLYQDGFDSQDKTVKIYLAQLDPLQNAEGKGGQGWIRKKGTSTTADIVDPWGNPYRYRRGDAPGAVNPDFDLWSCGKDGKTNPSNPKAPESMDDIRNFK